MARPQQGNLKEQLAQKSGAAPPATTGGAGVPGPGKPKTLSEQINQLIPQLQRALPNNMNADRMARLALTLIRQKPALAQCNPMSFLGALMSASALGLEPNLVGHAYIVPYKRETTLIVGYKGMLELVRRSGEVIGNPVARLVYANDIFELEYGYEGDHFKHVPWFLRQDQHFTEGGAILGGYAKIRYKAGGSDIFYTPIAVIHAHRARSKDSEDGPWGTDYEPMCLKTVIRANWSFMPISIEDRNKLNEIDGNISKLNDDTMEMDVIDIEYAKPGEEQKPEEPKPEEPKEEEPKSDAA
ncbi:MAG: recombinase RecT [Syntrophobacteraceae bacterium]